MGVLYKNEHVAYNNFLFPAQQIFQTFRPQPGVKFTELDNASSILFFLLEGEIEFSNNLTRKRILQKNEIALIPEGSGYSAKVKAPSHMIACWFSNDISPCNRIFLESLSEYKKDTTYSYDVLPFQGEVKTFLDLLNEYLEGGVECKHLQQLKLQELFILFRAYYAKEQLADFFHPILNRDMDFKHFVLSNYKKVANVEEFARLANSSLSAFTRKFKKYFNESVYQWMLHRKTEGVLDDIQGTDKSFLTISLDWNFSSQAHLTKFIKQQCGLSPSQIREQAAHG